MRGAPESVSHAMALSSLLSRLSHRTAPRSQPSQHSPRPAGRSERNFPWGPGWFFEFTVLIFWEVDPVANIELMLCQESC